MGTKSNIIIKRPEHEEYASVYCHWDGYPSHNGRILLDHYKTYNEVVKLISLGGISELNETVESTISYYKWRGEKIEIKVSNCLEDHTQQTYSYLYKDYKWLYKEYSGSWQELTDAACDRD